MTIKDYSLNDSIKRKLGIIIREERKMRFAEHKVKQDEGNPYTKENFCGNNAICHFHTLTRLETDIVKEDFIYHQLLEKLDLYFQIEVEDHEQLMLQIEAYSLKIFHAIEYLNPIKADFWLNELIDLNLKNDCIAHTYAELYQFLFISFFNQPVKPEMIKRMEGYESLFEGANLAFLYQALGMFYEAHNEFPKAFDYIFKAKTIFESLLSFIGVKNYPLIDYYLMTNNYYEVAKICRDLEVYFEQTQNTNRLFKVYNNLSNYYLLINAEKEAERYYRLSKGLSSAILEKSFMLDYNWGIRKMNEFKFESAKEYFLKAYDNCQEIAKQLQIINKLLIVETILKSDEGIIQSYIDKGQQVIEGTPEIDQLIFRYFIYKTTDEGTKYYRRYAENKVIPYLKEYKNWKIILLFFYEDLYGYYV